MNVSDIKKSYHILVGLFRMCVRWCGWRGLGLPLYVYLLKKDDVKLLALKLRHHTTLQNLLRKTFDNVCVSGHKWQP